MTIFPVALTPISASSWEKSSTLGGLSLRGYKRTLDLSGLSVVWRWSGSSAHGTFVIKRSETTQPGALRLVVSEVEMKPLAVGVKHEVWMLQVGRYLAAGAVHDGDHVVGNQLHRVQAELQPLVPDLLGVSQVLLGAGQVGEAGELPVERTVPGGRDRDWTAAAPWTSANIRRLTTVSVPRDGSSVSVLLFTEGFV
ncbi:hypothetical protein EYF80_041840 [Liparis tanakae]|uniref:Uncharacterized protein n=1 Tax=Liparis tanakae TaxID=230148 RepID=A0A4Z2G322_9TELE|nr:hypothetical protein EYF80_041840 [Liparis tanakae]